MAPVIDPEIYGKDLRISCLADFLEQQAVKGNPSMSKSDLADLIENKRWHILLEPRLEGAGMDFQRLGDAQDQSIERAGEVFQLIARRQQLLTDLYPFDISGNRVIRTRDANSYIWFLSVSLLHGLSAEFGTKPSRDFEGTVTECLISAGLPSVTVGTSVCERDFKAKVDAIASHFPELVNTVQDAVISRSQQDGGIDTFSMLHCKGDNRHGQWAFIGQSTVGKTESWAKKIHEPKPNLWNKIFGERIIPLPFFATPHHITDEYLKALHQDHQSCIIDRIRLVSWMKNIPDKFDLYHSTLAALVPDQ